MGGMTIGRLAEAANVGVETVRFYQRRGLLPVPRSAGAVRRYDEEDLRRLRFIRRAATAGFTLADIAELIRLDTTEDRPRAAAMAADRLAALDIKIAELEASRAALARLSAACGKGEEGPCPILEAFDPD
ncbi:MerR family transcriptional regulator [Aquisediminimonas profunda]|uniref:MerR family transcriptional regulator n=1 Tax=Aquisediminimonas profunda TaxID=1550733 RepID=UPI001C62ED80|nr:MerR family transcriptional regulator [Aquisediminimonas profunda]